MEKVLLLWRIRVILSSLFVLLVQTVYSQHYMGTAQLQHQHDEKCGAIILEQKQEKELGVYGSRDYFESWIEDKKAELRQDPSSNRTLAEEKRVIPIVVHVIHNGTPIGEDANIPLSQIEAQIAVLNEDFRRLNADQINTPEEFLDVAGDANIEFVLAKQDPSGMPTNGVNRVLGPKSNYSTADASLFGQIALWPPEEYFNIWVAPLIPSLLGYSSFPVASGLPGLDFAPSSRETDGVTIDYHYFGQEGNALASSRGRTTTHEVGHFFGLRHIWGDGDCSVDDFVDDTPNQDRPNNFCVITPRFSCGSRDMIENFMDYTADECMNLFTRGQVERMNVVLNFSPRRGSLINNRATMDPILHENNLLLQSVLSPQNYICSEETIPQIVIRNSGSNTITSTDMEVRLGNQLLERKTFTINLPTGELDTLAFSPISIPPANESVFEIRIVSVNNNDDLSELPTDRIQTTPVLQRPLALPYDYEPADLNTLWTVQNPDDLVTWEEITLNIDGEPKEMLYLNAFNYEIQGEMDYLISPPISLVENPNAQLRFELAYAPFENEDFQESLLVAISTDCGNTFELLSAPYNKSGNTLSTTESTFSSFEPNSSSQFRTELVNLSQFAEQEEIRLAFIAINGFGNNIYIRDISITDTEELRYDFEITDNLSPSPVPDGNPEIEVLSITNTGNLPIRSFTLDRRTNNNQTESFLYEDLLLPVNESLTIEIPYSLNDGENWIQYHISLPNFDQNGSNDSELLRYFLQSDVDTEVPWRQNFNSITDLEPWISINPENNEAAWQLMALATGDTGNNALELETMQNGNSYWLASPLFDLSSSRQASLFFEFAAGGFTESDQISFELLVSTDGGESFDSVWALSGAELNTVTGQSQVNPNTPQDFNRFFVDISAYTGRNSENVRIAFKLDNRDADPNPVYLDNIELFLSSNPDPVIPDKGEVVVFPNPTEDLFNISFNFNELEDVNIQFISPSGQVLYDVDFPNTLNQTYTFSKAILSKGLFIIKINSNSLSETKRLIIH